MSKNVEVSIAKIEKKLREIDEGKWPTTAADRAKLVTTLTKLRRQRDADTK